ncbi:MAG TPA: hypothetical protein VFJ57_08190 [Solirubrobacterales bacterium]|nr:hypothetical protein [Solirubrobacterales bacterium]
MIAADFDDRITRITALALGAAIVLVVVLCARPAGGHGGVLPASLRVSASQDGALAVSPAAPKAVLEDARLRPGAHAGGQLRLRNQTGSQLAVRLRAEPTSTALDGILRVRIEAGGESVFDSTLQALRQGTEDAIRLGPGQETAVRVSTWIPATEATGYEGRHVDVLLVPEEGPAR